MDKLVHIETVDLCSRGVVLPADQVGMVIAQPHVPEDSLSPVEPYQCVDRAKEQRLAALRETLAIARAARHGVSKTHFTIIPEYSIPGPDGIRLVEDSISRTDWPAGTVVIGGTDGLTQAQYIQLIEGAATHVDTPFNGNGRVEAGHWVNCAITWVKSGEGKVERWIQPKLHPAWEEMDISYQHMFQGRSIFVFNGLLENRVPYRFGTVVCFDWIATVEAQRTLQWILGDLEQQATPGQLPLSWLFVIQRNPKPSHQTFLNEVGPFFDQTKFPNALRERACLVFANTAGKEVPGRSGEFGATSLVLSHQSGFSKSDCVPTFSNGGPKFRDGSDLLSYYKDVFFRERGACIHSFAQINPGSLLAGPAGRALAAENAHVYPIDGVLQPRAPGGPVPACVKWLNDELDDMPSLSKQYAGAALV